MIKYNENVIRESILDILIVSPFVLYSIYKYL